MLQRLMMLNPYLFKTTHFTYVFTEREKSIKHGESPVEPISSCRDEHGFVPTVGRWGNEWPS